MKCTSTHRVIAVLIVLSLTTLVWLFDAPVSNAGEGPDIGPSLLEYDTAGTVPDTEVALIQEGIDFARVYLRDHLGGDIGRRFRKSSTVRVVATGDGDPSGGGACCTANSDGDGVRLFFDVQHPDWNAEGPWGEANKWKIAAHEYVHAWQFWLGCMTVRGSTPLRAGRMRAILECDEQSSVGQQGVVRVELTRRGLPTLSDERPFRVVEPPPARPGRRTLTLPPFDVRPVAPHDEQWAILGWPDDVDAVASSAEMEEGVLVVYYSTAFLKYAHQRTRYEQRDATLADSFTKRYEVWLAAHSLLLYQDQQSLAGDGTATAEEENPELAEAQERQERCRMATVAGLFASREVEMGAAAAEAETSGVSGD